MPFRRLLALSFVLTLAIDGCGDEATPSPATTTTAGDPLTNFVLSMCLTHTPPDEAAQMAQAKIDAGELPDNAVQIVQMLVQSCP